MEKNKRKTLIRSRNVPNSLVKSEEPSDNVNTSDYHVKSMKA